MKVTTSLLLAPIVTLKFGVGVANGTTAYQLTFAENS
jgi:hypothetical protein